MAKQARLQADQRCRGRRGARLLVAVIAVVGTAAGCTHDSQPMTFTSAPALAKAINCDNFRPINASTVRPLSASFKEAGECSIGSPDDQTWVYVFTDEAQRDRFRHAHQFDGNGQIAGEWYWVDLGAGLVEDAAARVNAPIMGEG